jgi:hypothetical protein
MDNHGAVAVLPPVPAVAALQTHGLFIPPGRDNQRMPRSSPAFWSSRKRLIPSLLVFAQAAHPQPFGLRASGSLVHHLGVGGLGWVADAPEVPSSHRPCG